MIPLELHVEGFLSYRSRQSLDFRPLIDAGLFGILGPTGSGKSALLEAILLALYGKCPRQKGNELGPLFNHHCSTLVVELLFQLHRTGQTELYRCRYRARLKSDRRGLQHQEHLLERWDGQMWQRERQSFKGTEERVSELLGLDYENFCRSILLPQGRFDELLRLTPAQRAEALEVLFQLQHYNLGETVRRLKAESDARRDMLQQRLALLAPSVCEEQRQQLEQELEHLRVQCQHLEQRCRKLEAAEKELTTRCHHWEHYQRLRQEYEQQRQQLASSAEQKRHLERLQGVLPQLQTAWQHLRHVQQEVATVQADHDQAQQEFSRLRNELDQLLPRYEQLRHQYEHRHLLQQRLNHCRDALQCAELLDQLRHLDTRLAKGKRLLETLQQQRTKYTQRLTACRQHQQEHARELHTLPELLRWYEREHALQHERQQLERELQHLQALLQQRLSELHSRSTELPPPYRPQAQQAERCLEELDHAEHRLQSDIARLDSELELLRRRAAAGELARELRPGYPCPVCGSCQHPEPCPDNPELAQQQQELHTEREHLHAALLLVQRLRAELQADLRSITERCHDLTERLRTVLDSLADHRRHFCWAEWSPDAPEQKTLAERRSATLRQELQQLQAEEHRLQEALHKLEHELETARLLFQQLQTQHSKLAAQYELLYETLPEELRNLPAQALRELQEHTERQLDQLEREYPLLAQRYDQLRAQTESARLRCEYLAERRAQLTHECSHAADQFARLCTENGVLPEGIQPFLDHPAAISEELQRLQEAEHRLAVLAEQLAAAEPAATRYNPEQHEQLRQELQHVRTQLQDLHTRLGQLQERLQTLARARAEQQQLQHQLHELQLRSQRLKVLQELFDGKAFISFIAQEYLRSLCHQANIYFQQWTHGTLELTLVTAGRHPEFQVRDFLAGGSLRPVRTLSGGQLFQVSLALALALSDMVRASRLERCLFVIDEGFGSLDRENLFLVLDTLRQLRRQGRLVGLISHREELQQELEAYIRVRRDLQRGSLIEPRIW